MKLIGIFSLILLFLEIGCGFCTAYGGDVDPAGHLILGLAAFAVTAITLIWAMLKVSRKGSRHSVKV